MNERYFFVGSTIGGALATMLLAWITPDAMFTTVVIGFFLFLNAFLVGARLFPSGGRLSHFLIGFLSIISAQSILQTLWYYLAPAIGRTELFICTGLSFLLCSLLLLLPSEGDPSVASDFTQGDITKKQRVTQLLWMIVTFALVMIPTISVLWHAWKNGTVESIRTPWPLLPSSTLAAIALANAGVWLSAWKTRSRTWTAFLCAGALTSTLFIAPLVYKVGFGFDGFLHRASIDVLIKTGTLTPKPLYYIGQYMPTMWLSSFLHLPTARIDTWLVPITTLIIPFLMAFVFLSRREERGHPRGGVPTTGSFDVAALTLFLPLASFVATTPQSLAYAVGILGLICASGGGGYPRGGIRTGVPALALGMWGVAIHPIAGLPFFGAIGLLLFIAYRQRQNKKPFTSPLGWLILLFTAASVPIGFFVNSLRSSAAIEWNFNRLWHGNTLTMLAQGFRPPSIHISLWADLANFFAYALPLTLCVLAGIACLRASERRAYWQGLFLLGAFLYLAGFFLGLSGDFTFLIDYERGNYAERLFLVGQLFWLFPALALLGEWLTTFKLKTPLLVTIVLFFLLAGSSAQAYLALPRHDATVVGHGWSVGQADQEAVRFIDQDAAGVPYTVLANQSVSAAAIEAFGFRRYTIPTSPEEEQIFYYPIPTGGPLYQLFLRMTSEPSLDTAEDAARLTNSSIVYVVLNNYWWDADRVAEDLSPIANRSHTIRDGAARVYRIDVKNPSNR